MASMDSEKCLPIIPRRRICQLHAVTGARALRVTLNVGSAVHIAAGVIGLAAVAALMLAGAFDVLNATNLLSYSLVWLVPGLLISEWTRYI